MIDTINSLFVSVLNWIYSWVGNYGWSVVVFTLFVRLQVLPLDIKSRRGMRATMRIQPKLQALQKKYANDKEKLNQKTLELYRKEHVSMTAGCLPMLLQWPILIFMFTAMRVVANEHTIQMILDLQNGIEPVFQSWLWIKNVFMPDSFMSSILPAAGSALVEIGPVGYSSILTAENIEAARAFLATSEYAAIAAQHGANAFMSIPLNFIFFADDAHPSDVVCRAVRVCQRPVHPAHSRRRQPVPDDEGHEFDRQEEGQEPACAAGTGQCNEQRIYEVVLPAVLPVDLRDEQLGVLDLLDGGQRHLHHSEPRAQPHLRPRRGEA